MTVPLSLSSCLFGSQRSPSVAETTVAVARADLGTDGVVLGDSTLGLGEVAGGAGVSPSFCLTYD